MTLADLLHPQTKFYHKIIRSVTPLSMAADTDDSPQNQTSFPLGASSQARLAAITSFQTDSNHPESNRVDTEHINLQEITPLPSCVSPDLNLHTSHLETPSEDSLRSAKDSEDDPYYENLYQQDFVVQGGPSGYALEAKAGSANIKEATESNKSTIDINNEPCSLITDILVTAETPTQEESKENTPKKVNVNEPANIKSPPNLIHEILADAMDIDSEAEVLLAEGVCEPTMSNPASNIVELNITYTQMDVLMDTTPSEIVEAEVVLAEGLSEPNTSLSIIPASNIPENTQVIAMDTTSSESVTEPEVVLEEGMSLPDSLFYNIQKSSIINQVSVIDGLLPSKAKESAEIAEPTNGESTSELQARVAELPEKVEPVEKIQAPEIDPAEVARRELISTQFKETLACYKNFRQSYNNLTQIT
jgi:hypothetical protein